ncbi:MAG TPA: winged helix-turn-helix domain-containing protein [Anaerolineaceae bacterium]|nr:winged helix-turn-helix domain-containing protein [Anaerolineaceae bacterium]
MSAKVLFIADERFVQDLMHGSEDIQPDELEVASEVETGIQKLSQGQYEYVIVDTGLFESSGAELFRIAEYLPITCKVILLTRPGTLLFTFHHFLQRFQQVDIQTIEPGKELDLFGGSITTIMDGESKYLHSIRESASVYSGGEGKQTKPRHSGLIPVGPGTVLDPNKRFIQSGDLRVLITPLEVRLLRVFLENQGRLLTHQEIVRYVHGYEVKEWEAPRLVRPIISRLRGKLNRFPDGGQWIVNIRGSGYTYEGIRKNAGT